jgi:hypothetical protein
MRAKLIGRLELYILSVSKGDLSSVYDLTPDACRHGLNKEEWLKQVHYESPGQMRRFVIDEVYAGDYTDAANLRGKKWNAKGCATYQVGRKHIKYQYNLSLLLNNGEWYICSSGIVVLGADNHYALCSERAVE